LNSNKHGIRDLVDIVRQRRMKTQRQKRLHVGWIIWDQLKKTPFHRRAAVVKTGGIGLNRFWWIANYVNSHPEYHVQYGMYRRWKHYDVLLFLKSMGAQSLQLMREHQKRGGVAIFDANVNYYHIDGENYYEGMLPVDAQRRQAIEMTASADAVIADSRYIANIAAQYNSNVRWIPDNVCMDLVPQYQHRKRNCKKLRLLWSGQAVKLFELLAIEKVLLGHASNIELILVTNSLGALDRWRPGLKARIIRLLDKVEHQIIEYRSIEQLFGIYLEGGVLISPRFLDNTYNFGHTEWKITLGMACGRLALCSPVPSYLDVAERAGGKGIRVCKSAMEWQEMLALLIAGDINLEEEELVARDVVERYYETTVVGRQHAESIYKFVK